MTRGVFNAVEHRLKTFVRTELSRAFNQGKVYAFQKANVELVKFAGKSASACPICQPLVGNIYKLEEAPKPPLHPNCVHTLLPVTRKGQLLPTSRNLPGWDPERVYRKFFGKVKGRKTLINRFRYDDFPAWLRELRKETLADVFPNEKIDSLDELILVKQKSHYYRGLYAPGTNPSIELNYGHNADAHTLVHEFTHHLTWEKGWFEPHSPHEVLYQKAREIYIEALEHALEEISKLNLSVREQHYLSQIKARISSGGFGRNYVSGLDGLHKHILEETLRRRNLSATDVGLPSIYGTTNPHELIAETGALFALDKSKLEKLYPAVYNLFRKLIE